MNPYRVRKLGSDDVDKESAMENAKEYMRVNSDRFIVSTCLFYH